MDTQKIVDLEPAIRKIIELVEEEGYQRTELTEKDHEFYGDLGVDEAFKDNDPNFKSVEYNSERNLMNYLENLSLEELKIIRSLILTGAKITEEDIEEEELDELELTYKEFYNSVPDDKDTIVDDIIKESAHVDKYLRNGLMYSLD